MKRLILILSILFPLLLFSQDYYWYRGNKINLEIGDKEYVIYESDTIPQPYRIISKNTDMEDNIIYRIPSYKSPKDSTNDVFVTNRFNVKLKKFNDYHILQQMATLYHVEVLSDTVLPLWHTLQCTRHTQYNALELANIFYESGNFAAAKPEFSGIVRPACVNDTYFPYQWNLRNSGQNGIEYEGIDINYCQAHSITSGNEEIIIAVYDWGVELSHPNLNIYPLSYDTRNNSSPSQICYDNWTTSYHGTACAGIISDISDDYSGGAGISPSCPIMSISMSLTPTPDEIARGFHFAAANNCSVINCSWDTEVPDEEIDDAILYALQNGRNGLGCIVIFSAGNEDYPFVLSPADSHEEILVVGAINTSIQRRPKDYSLDDDWGSCYGDGLDVMAPGEAIPTTDLTGYAGSSTGNYYPWGLSGTSIAAPHVAAVAGLILSVNPTLTAKQVADIIESTAQKVGEYEYAPTEGRPNGTWNNEMGYGLVDAYAAVLAAQITNTQINGPEILSNQSTYSVTNIPTNASITWTYTYTPDIANIPTHLEPITFVNGNSTPSVLIKREQYLPTDIEIGPIIPDDTITIELANTSPSIPPKFFTGTVDLKATITSGGYTYVLTKTINLPSDVEELYDNEAEDILNSLATPTEKTNILRENPLSQYKLTCKNPVTSKGTILGIEYLSDLTNEYIPYSENYTIEIWHHQLGLIKRICDTTSNLYLDCGDLPIGVYQMILIINGEPVAQSKLLKL